MLKLKYLLLVILSFTLIPLVSADINITSPSNGTQILNTLSTTLNVSTGEYNSSVWWSINNGVINNTLCSDCNSPNWTTITFPRQGYFNLTVWANDSNGNIASDETTNLFVGNQTNLNTVGNENMDDTRIWEGGIYFNYGINLTLHIRNYTDNTIWSLIRFNTSMIPSGVTIDNATFGAYSDYVGDTINTGIHEIYGSYDWNETNVTWSNKPTQDTDFNNTPYSNITRASGATGWIYWDVNGIMQNAIDKGYSNTSFLLRATTFVDNDISLKSKEDGGNIPILNITYYTSNIPPNITILYPDNNTKFNTTSDYNISINITDDNDYVMNATLYINDTLNTTIIYPTLNEETFFLFNASSGTYDAWVLVYDSNEVTNTSENWTIRINSPPTLISTELNKTSGVVDTDDLNCSAVGEADVDSEDVLTLHYEWYNNSIAINYDAVALFNDNTTATETWYCEAWVADNYLNSSKYTSTSIIIGSSSTAPSIDSINATTTETLINSTSSFPTNNNSWINFSVSFTDANDNNWTAYFCTTPTFSTCVANASSEILCLSEANSTSKALSCDYNVSGATRGEKTFYGFVLDNESLTSSATSSTYEINFPPSLPTLTSPAVNTFIGINYTLLDWISTDDDSDAINYTVYVNSSVYEYTFYWNGSDSEYNFTNATTEYETYNWRIFVKDIHDYGVHNITLGNFTTDFTKPNLTISSPTHDTTYNAETVSLTLSANDFAIDVCNYTLYYKDTSTVKTNGEVSCTGSASLSTPYYTGGYQVIAYAYDKAGNSNSTEINFTTQASSSSPGGGGQPPIEKGGLEKCINSSWNILSLGNKDRIDLLLKLGGVSPKKSEFKLLNKGFQNVSLNLNCENVNGTLCENINITQNVYLPPSQFEAKELEMLITTPNGTDYDKTYTFNIVADDNECYQLLNVYGETPNRYSIAGRSLSIGKLEIPIFPLALVSAVFIFIIIFVVFSALDLPYLAWWFGFVGALFTFSPIYFFL